jgi:hypothetical protein
VLITTAPDGQGSQAVQVVMLAGRVVVQLDAVLAEPVDNQKSAGTTLLLWSIVPVAQAALTRVVFVTEEATR